MIRQENERIKRSRTRSSSKKKIRQITRWRNSRSSSRFFSFSSSFLCVCGGEERGRRPNEIWRREKDSGESGGRDTKKGGFGFSRVERKPSIKMPAIKRFQTVCSIEHTLVQGLPYSSSWWCVVCAVSADSDAPVLVRIRWGWKMWKLLERRFIFIPICPAVAVVLVYFMHLIANGMCFGV